MKLVGVLASVVETLEGVLKVKMTGGPFHTKEDPEAHTLMEFLRSWGGSWIWDGLVLPDEPSWIAEALANSTLSCITDKPHDHKKCI